LRHNYYHIVGTSSALTFYKTNDVEYSDLAKFIETINNWFDVLNSYLPSAPLATKCGYGRSDIKALQDECLDKAFKTVLHMRRINKPNSMLKFQEGFLLSIKSLQQMFVDLQTDFNLSSHKVNQDALENLFSKIRTRGGLNDHPTPLDALNRLRIIILGKTDILQSNTNTVERTDDEHYIVGKVLRRSGIELAIPSAQISESDGDSSSRSSLSSGHLVVNNYAQKKIIQVEADGLEYLAGWIAKKLKSTHPELGHYMYVEENKNEHSYCLPKNVPSWIRHLSFGGLIQPSEEFLEHVQLMEKIFCKYTRNHFTGIRQINVKLLQELSKKCTLDDVIIKTFVRQRIFIKIHFLNVELQQQNSILCNKIYKRHYRHAF
jgi:hypothetical protein